MIKYKFNVGDALERAGFNMYKAKTTGLLSQETLKKRNIAFEYNHFGTLTADFYGIGIFEKVDFEHIQGEVFEICIA